MPYNGLGQYYGGTPIDIAGNMAKGAQAREAVQKSNLYAMQMQELQRKQDEEAQAQKAVNLYNDYGTAPGVGPDDLRQMYHDQGIPIQGQKIIQQVDASRKQKLSNMALASLSIDDPAEQKEAFKYIHSQLTPQEQQQFGSPDTWTRPQIVSLIGNDDVKEMMKLWTEREKHSGKGSEVLATPQLVKNPKTGQEEMWYFDKSGSPKTYVRRATDADRKDQYALTEDRKRAELEVSYEKAFPKMRESKVSFDRNADFVASQIDKALEQVGYATAGVGGKTSWIPGTPAKDLAATLATIKANIGFDKLQEMRSNSPTGGALGNVSDNENKLLQAVQGSLEQDQSPKQLKENLANIKRMLSEVKTEKERAYREDYGKYIKGGSQPASPSGQKVGRFTVRVKQ